MEEYNVCDLVIGIVIFIVIFIYEHWNCTENLSFPQNRQQVGEGNDKK